MFSCQLKWLLATFAFVALTPTLAFANRRPLECNSEVTRFRVATYVPRESSCHPVDVTEMNLSPYTHVIFDGAVINRDRNTLDGLNEFAKRHLHRLREHLQQQRANGNTRLLVSLSGFYHGTFSKFSNNTSIEILVNSIHKFLQDNEFDGVYFHDEFLDEISIRLWQRNHCLQYGKALLNRLRRTIGPEKTVGVGISNFFTKGTDVKLTEMETHVDFFVHPLHNPSGVQYTVGGHQATNSSWDDLMTTKKNALDRDVPRNKLVFRLQTAGEVFHHKNPTCKSNDECRLTTTSVQHLIEVSKCRSHGRKLPYFELKLMAPEKKRWTQEPTKTRYTVDLAFGNHSWIAYDNPVTILYRMYFVRRECLGGVSIGDLDDDDDNDLSDAIAVGHYLCKTILQ